MLLLGLDTATESVGAAVLDTATDRVLAHATHLGPAAHGEQLAPLVAQALARAGAVARDLSAIGVGRGPGPYTGLRVGLVHAEVLGLALGIPVHGVCTLDVLAAQARAEGVVGDLIVATDARRREVYWARYDGQGARVAGPEVGPAGEVPDRDVPAVGAGAARYAEHFSDVRGPLYPDPAWVARLAARALAAGEPADLSPMYLRRPDAALPGARKRVTPA